jgi:hypothetical protein
MKHCPNCAAPYDGLVPFCWQCGRDAKERIRPVPPEPVESGPLPTAAGAVPSDDPVPERSGEAETRRTDVALVPKPAGHGLSLWALVFAGVLVALATMLAIGRKGVDAPQLTNPPPAASRAVPAPLPADHEQAIESAPPPGWIGARRATSARDGSKTIVFELAASNDVGVWMKRVQPQLLVRCLSRTTEVFVATGSAASIEGQDDSHTVRIQFDDGEPVAEAWSDSVSSQELYAPDGVLFARRLARAGTMQFGFTPYNSAPVVARFDVRGFDQLIGLVADACGWRVDHEHRRLDRRQAARN